ncbi:ead/Ea22-like family protein [Escherichia coli]|uniref:ead/Ea22-like family protein n=1 Tax=Escherichia coli TaxID=562 RepID=UPI00197C9B9F|nr:ead/Ea22-like family protein [Escherichia coli]MCQ0366413.1 ead/Ea22-like family protein [Escherichia coli]
MRKINYQALRDAAEKATQGEWVAFISPGKYGTYAVHTPGDNHHGDIVDWPGFDEQKNAENNARYIAAFNPEVVQALLDERERNQQYIKRRDQENEDIALTVGKLRVELEAAEKRIAELESLTVPQLPQQAVPDEMPEPDTARMFFTDAVVAIAKVQGWNACRAAMLHSAEPVSQAYKLNALDGNSPVIPDGWISCSERMPVDGQHVIILCDGAFVLYAQYRDGEFFDIVRNGDEFFETQSRNVTDWMPLPEPPQEMK